MESQGGEEVSTECRDLQAATTVRPTRGKSFHVSARTNTPSADRKIEEREETVAHGGGRICQTGRRERKEQKRGEEQRLKTRTEAKAIVNSEEIQREEDTAKKGDYRTQ